ncbi:D-inositol-3-phosphate glycosyltransferase [Chryseobacterium gleum]|uniref:D-inositol-3-phosphate glycosyltransferase n=3 Tax=Chryseobacterium gleum TaxID=250 RepID=A0A3S4QYG0_CHRGE|nr:glycosyltransferase family 4 protein [Chryseobacterium gleum]QQY32676.1 glycosyltransferase family 4 protein [Chryseobacterium gleum]VEE10096.1 D-inositol-3-phosphate glycosyltransferase [Chryseobacterium gleum]
MSETKKILLISHEASLSGAPILVLSVLKKLRQERKNYKVDVLLLRPGQLYEDFAKLSDNKIIVANYYNQSLSFVNRNFKKIQNAFFPKTESKEEQIEKITGRLLQNNYDLVYANTAETLIWTIPFYKKNIPTVVAIHELTFGIESAYSPDFIKENISNVSTIIAGSNAVANNLINRYNADPKKVKAIHSFVDEKLEIQKNQIQIKKELNIAESDIIMGIASSQELRKGTDLVPLLVKKIADKTDINFKFINLGGSSSIGPVKCSKLDAEKLGVLDKIIYVDHNKFPNDYINIFDIFLLLSREDPFPLVMLTAAKLKKPIVAFENSGGAVEFLENGFGVLAPYLDLDVMASEIVKLLQNKELRENYGLKIHNRLEKEYSEGKLTSEIFQIIDDLIN